MVLEGVVVMRDPLEVRLRAHVQMVGVLLVLLVLLRWALLVELVVRGQLRGLVSHVQVIGMVVLAGALEHAEVVEVVLRLRDVAGDLLRMVVRNLQGTWVLLV